MQKDVFINAKRINHVCVYAISMQDQDDKITAISGIFHLQSPKKACLYATDSLELSVRGLDYGEKRKYFFDTPDVAEYVKEFRNLDISKEQPNQRLRDNNEEMLKKHIASVFPNYKGIDLKDLDR